ncbi:MAG: putative metal-binding motif-containing protein [Myxococcota bacterium]|jgi:hypothetical protein|nr:putative metal-binding motif-containing protein [Myxococcota bacterium]
MRALARICFFALFGCLGSSAPATDAGGDAACNLDSDCDDGVYCNGTERCVDDDGARTCVSGSLPCADACLESEQRCEGCRDSDGDGSADAACGGTDCDDSDATVYPGATEVCDPEGIDEDCDPSTLGRDADGDGFVDAACCNGDVCGTDCNDAVRNANPDAPEVCNGTIDDDCDGSVDEGVTETFYRDVDGDSYGDPTITMQGCSAPEGWTVLCCDCDDRDPRFNPAATELCMPAGADEDCDDATDEGCDCTFTGTRPCGPGAPFAGVGACRDGTQTCSSAGTLSECVGAVSPSAETCNGLDDDCNGTADEAFACPQNASVPGTTACGRPGVRRCSASCSWLDPTFLSTAEVAASCDYCADTAGGFDAELAFVRTVSRELWQEMSCRRFGQALCFLQPNEPSLLHPTGAFTDPDAMGAIYGPIKAIGHGPLTAVARVRAFGVSGGGFPDSFAHPRQGWAVVVARRGTGEALFSGNVLDLGVPLSREGWSFEWRYFGGDDRPGGSGADPERDYVTYRQLRGASPSRVMGYHTTWGGFDVAHRTSGRTMRLEVRITPDNPRTAADETRIDFRSQVEDPSYPESSWVTACTPEGFPTSCGFRVRPGETFDIGVTSTSGGTGGYNRTSNEIRNLVVTQEQLCPG